MTLPALFSAESDDSSAKTFKKSNRRICRKGISSDKSRSGMRYKFMLEGVRQEFYDLQKENAYLRKVVMDNIMPRGIAEKILNTTESPPADIFLRSSILLDKEDECISEEENGEMTIERSFISTKKIVCKEKNKNWKFKPRKGQKEENKLRKDTFEHRIIHDEKILGLADAMSGNYAF